ncbi:S-adenosyl-L-methionine-dependent methyltransferase [Sarocladium strictum]
MASDRETGTGILPGEHWQQNAPEPERDDNESTTGDSISSSTASLTSSIFEYRNLHGRTYHREVGNADYWAANDEKQMNSMDINHHALTLACGDKLYLAPLDESKVQKVIDIGTGTGIWAIDFADAHPGAEVIGTDISPMQPDWVPPNLKFEIDDCTQEWTFPPNSADFIHMRWLLGSIQDWNGLLAQAFRCCKPGGWVQSFEPSPMVKSDDGTVKEDSALGQWGKFFLRGGEKSGRPFTVFEDGLQRKAMEAAGFVDIEEFNFKTPHGTWPKDKGMKQLGVINATVLLSDIEGYVLFMADTLGWSKPEISAYIAHLRSEVKSGKFHSYYFQKVIWGRKPE